MALISVQDLTFGYDGSAELLFEDANFQIDTDWRCGLVGRNGRGKTTFLNLLLGKYEYRGTISAPMEFDYFPFSVDEDETGDEIADRVCPELLRWKLLREMGKLELSEDVLYRPFRTLSNGERTKLLLCLLFLRDNRFLLIDEPTNHLDLHGREVLSRYLHEKRGFLIVSHDQAFLDGCIDHVLSINRATIEVQKGNCSTWLDTRRRQDAFELEQNARLKKEISRLEQTAREKASWADKSEREKIGFDPTKTEKSIGRRPYMAAKSKKANKRAKAIAGRQEAAIEEKSRLLKNIEKADALRLPCLQYRTELLVEVQNATVSYSCHSEERSDEESLLGNRQEAVGSRSTHSQACHSEERSDEESLLGNRQEAVGSRSTHSQACHSEECSDEESLLGNRQEAVGSRSTHSQACHSEERSDEESLLGNRQEAVGSRRTQSQVCHSEERSDEESLLGNRQEAVGSRSTHSQACHSEERSDEESLLGNRQEAVGSRSTHSQACHSEERSDEESKSTKYEILRCAQNDMSGAVFAPISFQIHRGDRISLSGQNGAGKTSLLKLLTGELTPSSGTIQLASGLVISYLPQDASGLSGSVADYAEENGLDLTMFLTFLRKLDFPRTQFEKPMEQFSMGQKKKVLLAKSLCEPAHLYLWDEPLNYIDILSRGQIEDLLLESQPTILFVEHDKRFCERIATREILLKKAE